MDIPPDTEPRQLAVTGMPRAAEGGAALGQLGPFTPWPQPKALPPGLWPPSAVARLSSGRRGWEPRSGVGMGPRGVGIGGITDSLL